MKNEIIDLLDNTIRRLINIQDLIKEASEYADNDQNATAWRVIGLLESSISDIKIDLLDEKDKLTNE